MDLFFEYFNLEPIHYLGLLAGGLGVTGPIPQIIKCWKTKSAYDLSLLALTGTTTSTLLWIIYGMIQKDKPLVICNSFGLVIGTMLVLLKLKYGRNSLR